MPDAYFMGSLLRQEDVRHSLTYKAVPNLSRISGDKSGTREEKRTEEKNLREDNTPLTPLADAGGKVSVASHFSTGVPADDRADVTPHGSSDTSIKTPR